MTETQWDANISVPVNRAQGAGFGRFIATGTDWDGNRFSGDAGWIVGEGGRVLTGVTAGIAGPTSEEFSAAP
jgi:hypothetical protein